MPKLIHAMIRVSDLERSKRFYCGALGMEVSHLTAHGSVASFFFVTDPDGYKLELLHRSGHYV